MPTLIHQRSRVFLLIIDEELMVRNDLKEIGYTARIYQDTRLVWESPLRQTRALAEALAQAHLAALRFAHIHRTA